MQKNRYSSKQFRSEKTLCDRHFRSVRPPVSLAQPALSHQQHQDQQSGEFENIQFEANKKLEEFLHFVQVVDTSQLVKDEQDIISTSKVACMLKDDQLHSLIVSSRTKNVLRRIFHEKTRLRPDMARERAILENDRCLLPSDYVKITKIIQISDVFLVGERTLANLLLTSLSMLEGLLKKLWIPEKIYEYNNVVYYNRDKQWIGRA